MKKLTLILTMGIGIVIFSNKINITNESTKNLYSECGIVVEVDYSNDIVTFETFNGNMFSFYGCEDYIENDIVSAIMNDNGTIDVEDDEIIKVKYSGYFEK